MKCYFSFVILHRICR